MWSGWLQLSWLVCARSTQGVQGVSGCATALRSQSTGRSRQLCCGLPLFSRIHLPSSTFQHNLQSACLRIVHTAASNSTISPPRFRSTTRCWTSMITKRGLLRMHRVVGDVGLLLDKETNERWEGTVTGQLVAALSMALPREEQDNDDIHPPWPIHQLPDPLV